jgi:hypothetical protein
VAAELLELGAGELIGEARRDSAQGN